MPSLKGECHEINWSHFLGNSNEWVPSDQSKTVWRKYLISRWFSQKIAWLHYKRTTRILFLSWCWHNHFVCFKNMQNTRRKQTQSFWTREWAREYPQWNENIFWHYHGFLTLSLSLSLSWFFVLLCETTVALLARLNDRESNPQAWSPFHWF